MVCLLYLVFYTPFHYMVRDTSERLERDHIIDPVPAIGCDFCRKEPALPENRIEGYQFPPVSCLFENVSERTVIPENRCDMVDLPDFLHKERIESVKDEFGHPATIKSALLLCPAVDEILQEEIGQHRRDYLYPPVHQPSGNVPMGKGIELEIYLAHYSDLGCLTFAAYLVKIPCCLSEKIQKTAGNVLPLPYHRRGLVQISVLQACSRPRDRLPDCRRIIEFGYTVTVKHCIESRYEDFRPVDPESRLYILYPAAHGDRNHRHICVTCIDKRLLYKGYVIACTTLASGLGDGHSCRRSVIFSGLQGLDNVPHHKSGRIAHFVIGIFQPPVTRFLIAQGKVFDIISCQSHNCRYQRGNERSEERSQDLPVSVLMAEHRYSSESVCLTLSVPRHSQALHKRPDTQLHRSCIVDIIEFQQRQ